MVPLSRIFRSTQRLRLEWSSRFDKEKQKTSTVKEAVEAQSAEEWRVLGSNPNVDKNMEDVLIVGVRTPIALPVYLWARYRTLKSSQWALQWVGNSFRGVFRGPYAAVIGSSTLPLTQKGSETRLDKCIHMLLNTYNEFHNAFVHKSAAIRRAAW